MARPALGEVSAGCRTRDSEMARAAALDDLAAIEPHDRVAEASDRTSLGSSGLRPQHRLDARGAVRGRQKGLMT
ncbi:MAG: hypothetical protein M5U08_14110 [Burkholderiales bacterium]|nr:hypothetical protein [Burkholderiales bacterium]